MTTYSQDQIETPHLRLPLQFTGVNGGALVNEQDTSEDVIDCIKAIIAYPLGARWDMPEFGIPDLLFKMATTHDVSAVRAALVRNEIRVAINVTGEAVPSDEFLRKLLVEVGLFA